MFATSTKSGHQGGVALAFRNSHQWQVESARLHDPNVISVEIVSGRHQNCLVGGYVPPGDDLATTLVHITAALDSFASCQKQKLILVGDLSINIDSLESALELEIAQLLAEHSLCDVHCHF